MINVSHRHLVLKDFLSQVHACLLFECMLLRLERLIWFWENLGYNPDRDSTQIHQYSWVSRALFKLYVLGVEDCYHSTVIIWLFLWLQEHKCDTKEFFVIQVGITLGMCSKAAATNLLFSLLQRKTGLVQNGEGKPFMYAGD